MNRCHVCLSRPATATMKCKLDCDGLEQEFCTECATMYALYRTTKSDFVFTMLKQRRADGIAWERANNVAAAACAMPPSGPLFTVSGPYTYAEAMKIEGRLRDGAAEDEGGDDE